jgi:tetratricopeptide (TPR) repeat protein
MKKWILTALLLFASISNAQVTAQKSLEDLKRDLEKVESSIETTREKMKTIGDARFLPELYFILAELNVNKARYMIAIKQLSNKGVPPEELDFTNEKRPKLQAVELYQQIVDKFPTNQDRDKALFFQAHEYREMGEYEKMIQIYSRLTREFPNSLYWSESQLIVANYVLDKKKDVEFALDLYKQILARPTDHFTPLARYKSGWAYINQAKWKDALLAFEGVLTTDAKIDMSKLPEIYKKTDVKQDALITMVWPYSEIPQAEIKKMSGMRRDEPLPYFQKLSPNLASYQKVLRRLGSRLLTKKRFVDGTRVYFALLQSTGELEARMEAVESVYRAMKDTQQPWPIVGYVEEVKILNEDMKSYKKNQPSYKNEEDGSLDGIC